MRFSNLIQLAGAAAFVVLVTLAASDARAQSSSMFRQANSGEAKRPLLLSDTSFMYLPTEPAKNLKINDIVTVIVEEKSKVVSEGDVQRRKKAKIDAVLSDFIQLDGLNIKPATQPDGDPRIKGSLDGEYRTNMQMQSGDRMSFKIAATIVDVRPNGNLVLEAHAGVKNNGEVWERSLTGIVRREDVLPNNTVLSEDIAELSIYKREVGHVQDSYRRGWLLKFYDTIAPF